ncbi:hypothetical protein A0J61_02390 [Choanephora cucurbitarum]|uniref:Uncharacterized protein n=1 Tax=Choanephora cucurbitarum TaxID=101091 RepID=A0A1C7NKH6_9FUNG|nr:hypothetical protein A0J61_02390 [Choanephora cucurbitarum]
MPSTGISTKAEVTLDKEAKTNIPPARKRGRPSKDAVKGLGQEIPQDSMKGKSEEKAEQQVESLNVSQNEQPQKRKRGRPPKVLSEAEVMKREAKKKVDPSVPKRGRGRPRKAPSE